MRNLIQRHIIKRGAKIINEVNRLYSVGEIKKAEKLKKKLPKDEVKMYWMIHESKNLRVEG